MNRSAGTAKETQKCCVPARSSLELGADNREFMSEYAENPEKSKNWAPMGVWSSGRNLTAEMPSVM